MKKDVLKEKKICTFKYYICLQFNTGFVKKKKKRREACCKHSSWKETKTNIEFRAILSIADEAQHTNAFTNAVHRQVCVDTSDKHLPGFEYLHQQRTGAVHESWET